MTILLTLFLGGTGTDMVNGIALASHLYPFYLLRATPARLAQYSSVSKISSSVI